MTHDAQTTATGEVTHVFAHRFVVRTANGFLLADLGPKGAGQVTVQAGDHVDLRGEMKPSELKVDRIVRDGEAPVLIEHKAPEPAHHADSGSEAVLDLARSRGFDILGVPRRKPKHFEVLARGRAGDLVELHVELDGTLRKSKQVDPADPKWAAELRHPA